MQNTGTKKEEISLTEMSEEMANKTRFDFLALLVKKSLASRFTDFCPYIDVIRLDRSCILDIWKGYLYLNIGSQAQGLKTDKWEMYPCSSNKKDLSSLIEIKEIKNLLDEIIVNKADYYVVYYNDLHGKVVQVGIEQFLREA
jgi:hypothetical protein